MKHNAMSYRIYALILMVATIVLALGMDRLFDYLREKNAETFNLNYVILWLYPLISLILGLCLLALIWYMLFRVEVDKVMLVVYLVIGLIILLFVPLGMTTGILAQQTQSLLVILMPGSRVYWAGAFLTAIGLIGLIFGALQPLRAPAEEGT
jgi:hypothetical protein